MAPDFIPFDATPEDIEARQVLREGVPSNMRSSLLGWIRERIRGSQLTANIALLRAIENNCDIDLGVGTQSYYATDTAIERISVLAEREQLLVAHYLLSRYWKSSPEAVALERVLADGRSKWSVGVTGTRALGLTARVPAGVQDAAESLIKQGGSAGQLLSKAWGEVHDLRPSDSAAYFYAVRAVEASAFPALGITSENATLGHAIRAIESRDAKWRLPFLREHTEYPSRDVLLGMLKSLNRGHRDRHGSAAYSDVTHDEALAAVFMAVALVGWFSGGLVQERNVDEFG